ncbi:MAG TPA: NAD(P)H-binding protein [Bryobacteraceae bacterium]|jgi:nucleoside-diphosphate-sugar epimerase|nr:NAD(P)H-binding protein [Bryobacteraceae bacterium]
MTHVAIFGAAGPIGHVVGAELDRRGIPFRVVGRTRSKLESIFGRMQNAEVFDADLADLRSAGAAARGVDTIIYTVGVPYTHFELHPKLMRAVIEAAASMHVQRLVLVTSVYSYGVPQARKVSETHPRQPAAFKGKMRKEQEDAVLEADAQGKIRGMVIRLPDFYGPYADSSLANPILRAALAGKTANWLGPVSTPHEFLYVPDAGPVIPELASRDDCYGQAWNLGGAGEITGAAFIQKVYLAAGREPKFRSVGKTLLRMAGWFNPLMRELPEMLYLQETPVILDDAKVVSKLGGLSKTSYDEGIRQTLEWMRGTPAG